MLHRPGYVSLTKIKHFGKEGQGHEHFGMCQARELKFFKLESLPQCRFNADCQQGYNINIQLKLSSLTDVSHYKNFGIVAIKDIDRTAIVLLC